MQIFTVNITRVVWPHVTNVLDLDTFPMSKSSIKTKAVLTMTDMTKSTELQAFIRQKDGYKVTVKISLCICVVLSWDELEVRQNLLHSDYEIYTVRLLVAIVNRHKSLQLAKRSNITLLPCLFMTLLAVSMITLIMLYHILARFEFQFIYLPYLIISVAWQAWHRNSKMNQPPKYQEMGFFPLCMTSRKTFQELLHSEN